MRRLIVLTLLCVAVLGWGQPADVDIVYDASTPRTLTWSEVTEDVDGVPLLPTDLITYEVFTAPSPFDEEQRISLGEVGVTEITVDLTGFGRGYYYLGVQAIGTDAEGTREVSTIAWSNDPASVDPTQRFSWIVPGVLLPRSPSDLQTLP